MKIIFRKIKIIISIILLKFGYKIIKKNPKIVEMSSWENEILKISLNYSMTPKIRMWFLLKTFYYIQKKQIEGAFVETGIWKGGNLILIKKLLNKHKLNMAIFGFDTFEGMINPTQHDFKIFSGEKANSTIKKKKDWNKATLENVKYNILNTCGNLTDIHLVEGDVSETLKITKLPEKISILRLDTDFYESTKIALEILYPRLMEGGVLIIDDYGNWSGAKKAVDEYFGNNRDLFLIDEDSRFIIK